MPEEKMESFKRLFVSRLDTLSHILEVSMKHFENEGDTILSYRLIEDMHPFGTQIVFTCNQAHNFTRWCEGKAMENLPPELKSLSLAKKLIEHTKQSLSNVKADDKKLLEVRRIELSENQYLELPGIEYLNDFLIPNGYFHLVTAYNIMRMKGVQLGKVNYMMHLVSKVTYT
jgi:hypothetical protein